MIDIDRIEMLARNATPGPWHSPGLGEIHCKAGDGCIVIASIDFPTEDDPDGGTQADADFIAALAPQTLLKLCAVVRAAQNWNASRHPGTTDRTYNIELAKAVEALNAAE